MKPIEIQSAKPSDYDEIATVWHTSASLPGVGSVTMVSRETLRARIEPEVANGWHITVARTDGQVVGFLTVDCQRRSKRRPPKRTSHQKTLVAQWRAEVKDNAQIARALGVSRSTVSRQFLIGAM